jgi:hypothetical protein
LKQQKIQNVKSLIKISLSKKKLFISQIPLKMPFGLVLYIEFKMNKKRERENLT